MPDMEMSELCRKACESLHTLYSMSLVVRCSCRLFADVNSNLATSPQGLRSTQMVIVEKILKQIRNQRVKINKVLA